jgi:hypothetical protein
MKNDKVCISKKVGYFSVFVLLLIIAVLFMSQAAEQQKSTSSRATKANLKPIMNSAQKVRQNASPQAAGICDSVNPLYLSTVGSYQKGSDYCPSNFVFGAAICQGKLDPLVGCTSSYQNKSTRCCRYGAITALADKCSVDFPSTSYSGVSCKESCGTNETNLSGSATKGCALSDVGGTDLKQGYCCGTKLKNTPATQPGITIQSSTNCGNTSHINCQTTTGDSGAVCLGNSEKAWCAYKVNGAQTCPGTKYNYPLYDQYSSKTKTAYCLRELNEAAVMPSNSTNYYCSYAQTAIKIVKSDGTSADDATRLQNCKNTVAVVGHSNDL